MRSAINKKEFTDVGELQETDDGGLAIKLTFGKPLKRIVKHLIGEKLEVGFKKLRYNRSNAQNKYLWGVVYITIKAWYKETEGIEVTKDAIHAHTLQKILDYELRSEVVGGMDVFVVHGKSTSRLNTKEFNSLVEDLQKYWAEKGCDIPNPRENNFLSDYLKEK